MANFFQVTVALILVSQTGDVQQLSVIGLGDMVLKLFGISIYFGLNSSVETLVSQANGAGNLHMCGVYRWTGRLIVLISFVPIALIMYHTETMLVQLQQKPFIVEYTQKYVLLNLPGILFFGFLDLERRFLTQFGLSHIPMWLQIGTFFICTLFMIVSVHKLHLGVIGIAISQSIANFILMIAMWCASARQSKIKLANCVQYSDNEITQQICLYLSYGVPNMFIIMIDAMCFQSMALVSGFFGAQQQAVQILLFSFHLIMFQIPLGFKCGICALVGNQVGSGDADEAKRYKSIIMNFCLVFDICEWIMFFTFRHYIIMIFTRNPILITIADDTIWSILLAIFVDFYQAIQFGVLCAIGKQKLAMIVDFITVTMVIGPLAYYLGFEWFSHEEFVNPRYPHEAQEFKGLGVSGLWLGIFGGYCFQIICYYFIMKCQNWKQICYEALEKHKEMSRMASLRNLENYSNLELDQSDSVASVATSRLKKKPKRVKLGKDSTKVSKKLEESEMSFSPINSPIRNKDKNNSKYLELT